MEMSNWEKSSLGELAKTKKIFIKTGPFGSQLHQSDYVDNGIPVVMPKDIGDWKISQNSIARTSTEMAEKLAVHKLIIGDIVYGRRGDIGRHALVKSREQGWLCGTGCIRLRLNEAPLIPEFLSLYLRLPNTIEQIYNQAVGSTMMNLNTSIIENVEVYYPPFAEQQKIVNALLIYDDLIENNNRRIAILEEMAQKLYREWFVNFRFPGHKNVKMVESELGMFPDGWEVKLTGDIFSYSRGKSYTSKEIDCDDGLPFINLKNMQSYGGFKSDGTKNFSGKYKDTHIAQNGDIVLAVTDMTQERRLVGQAARLANIPGNKAVFSMDLIKINPLKYQQTDYIYSMFRFSELSKQIAEYANGANVLHLNPEVIMQQKLVIPPDDIISKYCDIASKIFVSIDISAEKNANLRRTRDLLLPRLISGDIDVSNLDILVREE